MIASCLSDRFFFFFFRALALHRRSLQRLWCIVHPTRGGVPVVGVQVTSRYISTDGPHAVCSAPHKLYVAKSEPLPLYLFL